MIPSHIKFYSEDGRGFFLNLHNGELYRLNTVAVRIVESLQAGIEPSGLPDIITSEFTVGYDRAETDIRQFLDALHAL